jgi:hypothetical protein
MNDTAILRNINEGRNKNDIIRHIEGNNYVNLTNGMHFTIDEDTAKDIFRLNVEATLMLNKHPNLEGLINRLKLKIEIHENS